MPPSNAYQQSREVDLNTRTSTSSAVGHNTASTAALNDIPHNVRMCDFAANTAACVRGLVSVVGDIVAIAKL